MTDADRLEAERAERRQVLATLEATLHDQQSRLAALGKDEKGLLSCWRSCATCLPISPSRSPVRNPLPSCVVDC
jgi:hypothetical protein